MPHIEVRAIGLTDPPPHQGVPITFHDSKGRWEAILLNGGTEEGNPSIGLFIYTDVGMMLFETTLELWLFAGEVMKAMAEDKFGWSR